MTVIRDFLCFLPAGCYTTYVGLQWWQAGLLTCLIMGGIHVAEMLDERYD